MLHKKLNMIKNNKIFILPVTTTILVLIIILFFYTYECFINKKVILMKNKAENIALKGNIDEAIIIINNSLIKRPNDKILQRDLKMLKKTQEIQNNFKKAEELKQDKKYDQAFILINKINSTLIKKKDPIYKTLKNKFSNK